jgi:hypothetical protein
MGHIRMAVIAGTLQNRCNSLGSRNVRLDSMKRIDGRVRARTLSPGWYRQKRYCRDLYPLTHVDK